MSYGFTECPYYDECCAICDIRGLDLSELCFDCDSKNYVEGIDSND